MSSTYQCIYLSPHLDDVVLSCGGQIASRTRRGESVLVATLAAGDPEPGPLPPLARDLHAAWKLDATCAVRREEDRRACALLGADVLHVAVPEAMYRTHSSTGKPLYPTLAAVFGAAHPDDPVGAAWKEAIDRLPPAPELVVPLGAGGHVDHQLVRRAAESAQDRRLAYFEDYPYANRIWAVRRTTWPPWRWKTSTVRLAPEDVRARCEAAAAYASQIDMLFAGAGNLEGKVRGYVRRAGGERLWTRR